jgi:tRNA 2-thiouridine synthesizing protein A
MSKKIDARGLSCPQPVLLTLEEIKRGNEKEIVVLVDTVTSRENVMRAASSKGCRVEGTESGEGGYQVTIRRD